MPIIQDFPDELDYVNAKLHPMAPKVGRFLELFLNSCYRADSNYYPLLQPLVRRLMEEHPADSERLEMERHDRGV